MTRTMWLEDDLAYGSYDPYQERGETFTGAGEDTYEPYSRPIGFIRRKPRVRVKAWTQPIPPKDMLR